MVSVISSALAILSKIASAVGHAVLKAAPIVGKVTALGFKAGAATKKATAALLTSRLLRSAPAVVKTGVKIAPFIAAEAISRVNEKQAQKNLPGAVRLITKPAADILTTGFQIGLI